MAESQGQSPGENDNEEKKEPVTIIYTKFPHMGFCKCHETTTVAIV